MIEKVLNIFRKKLEQREEFEIKITPRTLVVLCGVLWEFWNYWAIGKWIYTVPIPFAGPRIFEMPLLGFLGFPAFAVEVYSLQNFLIVVLKKNQRLAELFGVV